MMAPCLDITNKVNDEVHLRLPLRPRPQWRIERYLAQVEELAGARHGRA